MLGENRSERAILILDMINDFTHIEGTHYAPVTEDIIPFVKGEVQYFRERMRPVIYCNTVVNQQKSARDESFGSQVVQALSPRTGEILIKKSRPNAFYKTDLAESLTNLKVKNLTIVGAFTHTSVLLTAGSALDLGFSVVVPETCVCSRNPNDHIAALRLIARWLSE